MDGRTHIAGGALLGAAAPLAITHIGFLSHMIPVEHVIPFTVASMAGGVIGGLLPDIDSPTSLLGRRLKPISKIVSKTCGHRGLAHSLLAVAFWGVICFFLSSFLMHLATDYTSFVELVIKSALEGLIVSGSAYFFCESAKGLLSKKVKKKAPLYAFFAIFVLGLFLQSAIIVLVPIYLLGTVIGALSHLLLDALTVEGVPFLYPFLKEDVRFMRFHASTGGRIVKPICYVLLAACWITIFTTMVF